MADDLMRAFRDRNAVPSPQVTLAAVNPSPPPALPSEREEDAGVEGCGCFEVVRGPRSALGFRVRAGDRYYSCQYLALVRTGEASGFDPDLGKEALYVIFQWGSLVITGQGLAVLDELLSEHRITRLALGQGTRGVRIDEIRVVSPGTPPLRAPRAKRTAASP